MERARLDSKRSPVRINQSRRESRGRCQGILLLPGCNTNALYLKTLYKYPQAAYPYDQLVEENRRRSLFEQEFELIDTGVFNQDRYWDVFVEYAKATGDDILVRINVFNRGPDIATIYVLPQLWFRNTWSWNASPKPKIKVDGSALLAQHTTLGAYWLNADGSPAKLFCEN